MKNLTLRNITKACHGEYRGPENLLDKEVAGVTIDSRKVEKDYLFIAIDGERVNAHKFIPDTIEKGAMCVISHEDLGETDFPYILDGRHQQTRAREQVAVHRGQARNLVLGDLAGRDTGAAVRGARVEGEEVVRAPHRQQQSGDQGKLARVPGIGAGHLGVPPVSGRNLLGAR